MDENEIKHFVEAALLAAGRPLSMDQLHGLFDEGSAPEKPQIREAIGRLREEYEERGLTIAEVASGFRTQIKPSMAERLGKLWEERPPRYSRALFETLALIAYRQPMTRGEIEEIRGVAVSTNIIRTLMERDWIRVVGHRDVPGRPAMFGTTKQFLDYFGLKKLDDLPPLADLSDWESLRVQLNLPAVNEDEAAEPESADVTELPVLPIGEEEIAGTESAAGTRAEGGDTDEEADEDTDELPVMAEAAAEADEGHAETEAGGTAADGDEAVEADAGDLAEADTGDAVEADAGDVAETDAGGDAAEADPGDTAEADAGDTAEADAGKSAAEHGFEEIVAKAWPDPRATIAIRTGMPEDDEPEDDLSTAAARRAGD